MQRIVWLVIAALLLAAIAGVFGGGILSNTTARYAANGNEIELTYPRLGRAESNLKLELSITAPEASASGLTAIFAGEFVDQVSITGITPEPDSQSFDGDAVRYRWSVDDWSRPLAVRLEYEARDWRRIDGSVHVHAGNESLGRLEFGQFLFP